MKRLMTEAKLGERLYAYNFPSCFLLPFLPGSLRECAVLTWS